MYNFLHYLYFGIVGLVILVALGVHESRHRVIRSIPTSPFERGNMRQRWSFLMAGIALLGGIAFVNTLFNFADWRREEYFQKNSVTTEAVVLESYRAWVSYDNGFTIDCSDDVVYSFWIGTKEYTQTFPRVMKVLRAGEKLPIRYMPGHPEMVEIQGLEPKPDFAPLIWFCICGILAMVVYKKREECTVAEDDPGRDAYFEEDSGPSFAPPVYNPQRTPLSIEEEFPLNPLPHEAKS